MVTLIRDKQNITQQEMADFLGIDCRTYKRWENGETKVDSDLLPKIAKFLNVEIGELYKEKPGDIVINQTNHNSDNKKGSINNGIVIILPDKEAANQIFEILKKEVEKQ